MPAFQEQSLLRNPLVRGGLSGLSAVGNLLDLPGSMARDVMTLNNPFDQLLDPLGDSNRLTGRDVLRQYGVAGEKDNWMNFGAGLGLEIATDPLTFLSFGGTKLAGVLGDAGQAASKAGVLDEALRAASHLSDARLANMGRREALATLTPRAIEHVVPEAAQKMAEAAKSLGINYADIVDKPLGGAMGVALRDVGGYKIPNPFGQVTNVIGTGADSKLMPLLKALDRAEEFARWSAPGRTAAALFDSRNMGLSSRLGQETAQRYHSSLERIDQAVRESAAPYIRTFEDAGVFDNADLESAVTKALEGVKTYTPHHGPVGWTVANYDFTPGQFMGKNGVDLTPQVRQAVDEMRQAMSTALKAEEAAGLDTKSLNDYMVDYFPRSPHFMSGPWSQGYKGSRRVLPVAHPFQKSRDEAVRNVGGGTATLNKLAMDPEFSGVVHSTPPDRLTKAFWDGQVTKLKASPLFAEIAPKVGSSGIPKTIAQESFSDPTSDERLKMLVKWAGHLDPQHAATKTPVYHSPIVSYMRRLEYGNKAIAGADVAFDVLRNSLKASPDPGDLKLSDVLDSSGLGANAKARMTGMLTGTGMSLDSWVPKSTAADVGRVMKPFTNPDEVSAVVEHLIDPVTALFKGSVTTPWPAFHIRNLASGQIQNYLGNAYKTPASGARAIKDMDALYRGGVIADAAQLVGNPSLSPQEATKVLADMMFSHGVTGKQGIYQDVANAAMDASRRPSLSKDIPGLFPGASNPLESVKSGIEQLRNASLSDWNPLKQRGVSTADNEFIVSKLGDDLGHYIESLSRGAPFIDLLRHGLSPEEAARRVKALQVDYGSLSDFERTMMKRIFPFYSFSKGASSYLVDELMSRPGGRLAQALRFSNRSRGDEPGMPDYVSQSTAIDLGETQDGSRSYITGLGLMHEDPLSMITARNGLPSIQDFMTELASRSNPIIKAPLELATGESFFQRGPMGGRDLEDMDPTVGRILSNVGLGGELPSGRAKPFISQTTEHLLANSPMARLLTTIRTATDARKWEGAVLPGDKLLMNLATGVRISDISPAAQDAVIRDELFATIRRSGGSVFSRAYFPKDAELGGDQIQLNELAKLLAERAKLRAKEKAAAGQ